MIRTPLVLEVRFGRYLSKSYTEALKHAFQKIYFTFDINQVVSQNFKHVLNKKKNNIP